jgi:hypothetical protein
LTTEGCRRDASPCPRSCRGRHALGRLRPKGAEGAGSLGAAAKGSAAGSRSELVRTASSREVAPLVRCEAGRGRKEGGGLATRCLWPSSWCCATPAGSAGGMWRSCAPHAPCRSRCLRRRGLVYGRPCDTPTSRPAPRTVRDSLNVRLWWTRSDWSEAVSSWEAPVQGCRDWEAGRRRRSAIGPPAQVAVRPRCGRHPTLGFRAVSSPRPY